MGPSIFDANQNNMQKKEVAVHWEQVKPLTVGKTKFRSVHDCHLTEEDLKQAHSELGETEALRNIRLKELKEKLQKSNKRGRYRLDDQYLLRYLRHAKFDCNKAFKVIEKFNNLRIEHPEEFKLSSKMEEVLDAGIVRVLPYRDEQHSFIYYITLGNWNMDEISFVDIIQTSAAISDLMTMNPSNQVHSVTGIWDISGFGMQHFRQFINPSTVIFLRKFLLETYPWRIKSFTVFNCNKVFRTLYNAMYYLFKKKVADRVRLLGYDQSELHQHVNKVLLPKRYGGTIDESECLGKKFVMQNLDYLRYERSFIDAI